MAWIGMATLPISHGPNWEAVHDGPLREFSSRSEPIELLTHGTRAKPTRHISSVWGPFPMKLRTSVTIRLPTSRKSP